MDLRSKRRLNLLVFKYKLYKSNKVFKEIYDLCKPIINHACRKYPKNFNSKSASNEILVISINTYDSSKGNFSNHLTLNLRGRLLREYQKMGGSLVRLPYDLASKLNSIGKDVFENLKSDEDIINFCVSSGHNESHIRRIKNYLSLDGSSVYEGQYHKSFDIQDIESSVDIELFLKSLSELDSMIIKSLLGHYGNRFTNKSNLSKFLGVNVDERLSLMYKNYKEFI